MTDINDNELLDSDDFDEQHDLALDAAHEAAGELLGLVVGDTTIASLIADAVITVDEVARAFRDALEEGID